MENIHELSFTEKAGQSASNVATMMLYQVLLGRDPENSHVIEQNKTQPVAAVFRSFIGSAEFSEFVIKPVQQNTRLRHEFMSPAPSASQREWICSLLSLPLARRNAIATAPSWRDFFIELLSLSAEAAVIDAKPHALDATVGAVPAHPVALPMEPGADAGLLSLAMAEISAIQQRIDRLKELLRAMSGTSPE